MITNYLPYIYGSFFLFLGIYSFLYSFRIYKPKFTDEAKQALYENRLKRYHIFLKIASIAFIISGGYDLIVHNVDRYRIVDERVTDKWSDADKKTLTNQMLRDIQSYDIGDTTVENEYANCAAEKIMKAMTPQEFLKNVAQPDSEKKKIFSPILKNCLDRAKQELDSLGERKVTAQVQ